MRKDLVVDTDLASFVGALFSVLAFSGLAALYWWHVVRGLATQHAPSWQDYAALVLAVWLLITGADIGSRFVAVALLAVEVAAIAAHWVGFSSSTQHVILLCSNLALAVLSTMLAMGFAAWIVRTLRTAQAAQAARNH